jgi:hypothetical protein
MANRYAQIIELIFLKHYTPNATEVLFSRDDLSEAASQLGFKLPKNIGDVVYSFRYRVDLPAVISQTAPTGTEWVIKGRGVGLYSFVLTKLARILPQEHLLATKIPDSTPEIIRAYAQGDEQALLAIIRYNRLIDIFLGIASYSLQNHLRTTVKNLGQIEIDELYVGVDKHGKQYIIPVQAKGGKDQHGVVQTEQDIACCLEKFPDLICRPISAQFLSNGIVALFELAIQEGQIYIVQEKHYALTQAHLITQEDLALYRRQTE